MRRALTEALIDFEGALVVVSHDRHLIRSTTDDLYLVHDKGRAVRRRPEDYQQWLSDVQKQENRPTTRRRKTTPTAPSHAKIRSVAKPSYAL